MRKEESESGLKVGRREEGGVCLGLDEWNVHGREYNMGRIWGEQ